MSEQGADGKEPFGIRSDTLTDSVIVEHTADGDIERPMSLLEALMEHGAFVLARSHLGGDYSYEAFGVGGFRIRVYAWGIAVFDSNNGVILAVAAAGNSAEVVESAHDVDVMRYVDELLYEFYPEQRDNPGEP